MVRKQNWLLEYFLPLGFHFSQQQHADHFHVFLLSWLVHCMGLCFLLLVILATGEGNMAFMCCFMQLGNLLQGKWCSFWDTTFQPAIYGYCNKNATPWLCSGSASREQLFIYKWHFNLAEAAVWSAELSKIPPDQGSKVELAF